MAMLLKKSSKAARGDNFGGLAYLRFHARDQSLNHRDIAPINADLHLADGVFADHAVVGRWLHGDPGQHGRGIIERIKREVNPRRNAPAQIGAICADMIKGRGGTKADDDLFGLAEALARQWH